jgi:hypothetical protein
VERVKRRIVMRWRRWRWRRMEQVEDSAVLVPVPIVPGV